VPIGRPPHPPFLRFHSSPQSDHILNPIFPILFANFSGYVLASVEGRVAVEYFDLSPAVQAKRYAFKCHRQGDLVFPVNAVAFHPTHGTFATGGCDGMVFTWDGQNKKRLAQLGPYKTSIAALAYNFDGSLLAVAASYTYEEGEKEHPPDAIFLRCPLEGEVRRKVKAAG